MDGSLNDLCLEDKFNNDELIASLSEQRQKKLFL